MVPSAPDARFSRVVATTSGPSLHPRSICIGETPRPRDKPPKIAFRPETVSAETETQPQMPANCGLLGRLREISRLERMRGGGCIRARTGLSLKFPASREFSREFFEKGPPKAILA